MTTYIQCELKCKMKGAPGYMTQVAWIPSHFAVQQKSLRIKVGEEWQQGWIVEWAGKIEITEGELARLSGNAHRLMNSLGK